MGEKRKQRKEFEQYLKDGDERFGGMFSNFMDRAMNALLEKVGVEQEQIDTAKTVIDMIEFTKIDGDDVLIVRLGDNIEVRVKI